MKTIVMLVAIAALSLTGCQLHFKAQIKSKPHEIEKEEVMIPHRPWSHESRSRRVRLEHLQLRMSNDLYLYETKD